ncbi:MAG: DUF4388 domain-containing protein [Actinobacteria bacterium]|nr:DUF4388 domain-containing protein [Actinomycetota bacterium]
MRGDLSETTVADLCRGLSAAGATGAVEVGGHAADARIFFRSGDVYWALSPTPRARLGDRLVNAGLLSQEQLDEALEAQRGSAERTKLGALLVERGLVSRDAIRVFVQEQILDALFEVMGWHQGTYVFNPGEVADEKLPIDIPVDQVLVEVSRRQSEWDQIQEAIPDLDMIPDFVTGGSSANAALEPDEFTVLANVDGGRSIRDLAEDLGYSEFEAARIVYGLTLLGIVDVRHPDEDTDDEAPSPSDRGDAAETGAGGDIDVASALEEAMGAREPGPAPAAGDVPRPRVKLHVDDAVRDYLPPHGTPADPVPAEPEPVGEPEPEPVGEPEPQVEVRTPEPGERSVDDLTAALTAALDDEPEPWVADPEATTTPADPDLGFFAGTAPADEPATPPADEPDPLDDDDFDALLSELGEGPVAPRRRAADGADEPEEAEPASPEESEDDRPVPPAEDERPADTPPRPGQGGDVSEFLRELSQLAIDDPPAGANPGAGPRPEEKAEEGRDAGNAAAAARAEERRAAAERADDRNKKRGLFGWGR